MKMRKEEGGSGMYQTRWIRSISVAALILAFAACEKAQEPIKGAIQLKATKVGEVTDLAGPTDRCGAPDGQKDQGIRLQIPPEQGSRVSYLELFATGNALGQWSSCSAPTARTPRFEVTEEGSDKPMGEKLDLSKGGVFFIHVADNGAFDDQATFELKGVDKNGREVFRVMVSG